MDAPRIVVDNRYKILGMEIILNAENTDKIYNIFIQQQQSQSESKSKIIVVFRVKQTGVEAGRWELGDQDTDFLRIDIEDKNVLWVNWFKKGDKPERGVCIPLHNIAWMKYNPELIE